MSGTITVETPSGPLELSREEALTLRARLSSALVQNRSGGRNGGRPPGKPAAKKTAKTSKKT